MLFFSRELIAEGSTGGLVIFEDRLNYWDAWGEAKSFWLSDVCVLMALVLVVDVKIHHLETPHQLEFTNISVIAQGALRAAVRALVTYGKSTVEVTVSVLCVLRARYYLLS
jgi:alpha-mannosidase